MAEATGELVRSTVRGVGHGATCGDGLWRCRTRIVCTLFFVQYRDNGAIVLPSCCHVACDRVGLGGYHPQPHLGR